MQVSEKPNINIFNADCIEALKGTPDNQYDLCVTDPPYGVGFDYNTHDDNIDSWRLLIDDFLTEVKRTCRMVVLPSMQIKELKYIYEKHPPDWLICWYKGSPGHVSYIGFNDWEPLLVYGKLKGVQMHDYFYCQPQRVKDINHPCPKPIKWYKILYTKIGCDRINRVLEPFGGSATASIACYDMGFDLDLYEIDKDYYDAGVKRFLQHKQQLQLFNGKGQK